jgi:hypothetical protein
MSDRNYGEGLPDRNGNWYALKVYGDKYVFIREQYQDEKMDEIK